MLAEALTYLRKGWSVIPLCPHNHEGVDEEHTFICDSPGKMQLWPGWKKYQKKLATPYELAFAWETWPEANLGVILGKLSNLIGVDVDNEEGLKCLFDTVGSLPNTATFITGRGMRLLYKSTLTNAFTTKHISDKCSILGDGSLTVMPPSIHHTGKKYKWVKGKGISKLARCPASLINFKVISSSVKTPATLQEGMVIASGRHIKLFKTGCAMRRHGCTKREIEVALLEMDKRCSPQLGNHEVCRLAQCASRYKPTD